jgi:hypothetical protein
VLQGSCFLHSFTPDCCGTPRSDFGGTEMRFPITVSIEGLRNSQLHSIRFIMLGGRTRAATRYSAKLCRYLRTARAPRNTCTPAVHTKKLSQRSCTHPSLCCRGYSDTGADSTSTCKPTKLTLLEAGERIDESNWHSPSGVHPKCQIDITHLAMKSPFAALDQLELDRGHGL